MKTVGTPHIDQTRKMTRYVRPEDYQAEKVRNSEIGMDDIIELKAVDMNYGFVPTDKEAAENLENTSKCNLKRFNLEPKDKPSEY